MMKWFAKELAKAIFFKLFEFIFWQKKNAWEIYSVPLGVQTYLTRRRLSKQKEWNM